jgi:hypothetical protein
MESEKGQAWMPSIQFRQINFKIYDILQKMNIV